MNFWVLLYVASSWQEPKNISVVSVQFISVQLLSHVQLFATPWTAACQASLSITNSQSLLRLMFIELVMSSNHLILCRPLLLLPSIFRSIRVFSNESVLCIRWPKYWGFSFSISPSNEYSGLNISETCFPCTASMFKPRIDSHHGGTWESLVGKPRGKASRESMGILQARTLEWVAMSSSRGSSQPSDQTQVSHITGRFFTS